MRAYYSYQVLSIRYSMVSKTESLGSQNSKTVEETDINRKISFYKIANCDNYCEIKRRVHSKCTTGEHGISYQVQHESQNKQLKKKPGAPGWLSRLSI